MHCKEELFSSYNNSDFGFTFSVVNLYDMAYTTVLMRSFVMNVFQKRLLYNDLKKNVDVHDDINGDISYYWKVATRYPRIHIVYVVRSNPVCQFNVRPPDSSTNLKRHNSTIRQNSEP